MDRRALVVVGVMFGVLIVSASLYVLWGTPKSTESPICNQGCGGRSPFAPSLLTYCPAIIPQGERVAIVKPVFTTTPYMSYWPTGNLSTASYSSFYTFYYFQGDISRLETPVFISSKDNDGWGASYSLYQFFTSPAAASCGFSLTVLTDQEVDASGISGYDVVVVGHEEYVTMNEYNYFKAFVANGGRLIVTSGDDFEVLVSYANGVETLVQGHGWQFDGQAATRSGTSFTGPFDQDRRSWLGSSWGMVVPHFTTLANYAAVPANGSSIARRLSLDFPGAIFQGLATGANYYGLEEDMLYNLTGTTPILDLRTPTPSLQYYGPWVYYHRYQSGGVVCLCVSSERIVMIDPSIQEFLLLALPSQDWEP